MVSVIIPLYNKEREIAKAIDSVLNQSFRNFELLIIDDGSTDNSSSIAQNFKDERIQYYSKINGGVSSARNYGIKKAKYELIAFLDGDDWWSPDFLSVLTDLNNKYPDAGLWAGQYEQVNKKNELITLNRFPKIIEGYFYLYEHLFAVWSSSILIKKSVFEECGYFDEELTHGEDTDMWIRIAMKHKVCYTNKIIAFYNIAGNPLTKSTGKVPPLENHLLSKIDKYIGIGYPEWDKLLQAIKAKRLRKFYLQYPMNKKIRAMIKSLPDKILNDREYKILNCPFFYILLLHIFFLSYQKIIYMRNLVFLNFQKLKQ